MFFNRFWTYFGWAAGMLAVVGSTAKSDEGLPTGLVKEKPAEGRFVETDKGFMVPYEVHIPGSKATFRMLPIPGGTFKMGSPESEEGREEDEGPPVEVRIEPFWMAECEVNWTEYKHFMSMYEVFKKFEFRGIRTVTDENRSQSITCPTPLYEPTFTFEKGEDDTQPAVTMSHYSARQYSKWMTYLMSNFYRLPTEAEWEYACRAGSTDAYSFGNDASELGEYAWYYDNADESYHDVGTKKPNAWGLHDMHGNVAELCMDQYAADTYAKLQGETQNATDIIVWTTKMFPHVIRGGSWDSDAAGCRSASRDMTDDWRVEDPNEPKSPWWFTDEPGRAVGFRLVRPLHEPAEEVKQKFWAEDSVLLEIAVDNRLEGGRGVRAVVDPELPEAAKQVEDE